MGVSLLLPGTTRTAIGGANYAATSPGTGLVLYGATSGYSGFKPNATAGSTVWELPVADGTSGQALVTNASGVLSFATIAATPGGADTDIQFNSGGEFAGGGPTWDGVTLYAGGELGVNPAGVGNNVLTVDNGGYASAGLVTIGAGGPHSQQIAMQARFYPIYGGVVGAIYSNNGLSLQKNGLDTLIGGKVGIGGIPTAQLHTIASSATIVPLSINLAAAQTANALEVNSSGGSGGDKARIQANGQIVSGSSSGTQHYLNYDGLHGRWQTNERAIISLDQGYIDLRGSATIARSNPNGSNVSLLVGGITNTQLTNTIGCLVKNFYGSYTGDGHHLIVQAGDAGVGTANGGNLTLTAGAGVGGGTDGSIFVSSKLRATAPLGGIGYGTGAGLTVAQVTSRTTGVTINAVCGSITLVSAAGSATPASFTVTNSTIAATDVILLSQQSGADAYNLKVTNVSDGSFEITYFTDGGTTTETPVFNFATIKSVSS